MPRLIKSPPSRVFLAITAIALLIAAATMGAVSSQSAIGNYDTDRDGLMEVSNLEQLNAIRYDLDGNGRPDRNSDAEVYAAAFPNAGRAGACNGDCSGYELARSLDFRDAASYASGTVNTKWTTGSGWLPIGNSDNSYESMFQGNGLTISNLYIERNLPLNNPGAVGLFFAIGGGGVVRFIGLLDVDVTGEYNVGGLAGHNDGRVSASYTTGAISGTHAVGGLSGSNNGGLIIASYSTSSVSSTGASGGLTGVNGRVILSSYAAGSVSGYKVGGLVGENYAQVIVSYATGSVSGDNLVGGLVGENQGRITDSL